MSHSRATSVTAYSSRGGLLETPDRLVPLSLPALDTIALGLRGADQVTASRELKQPAPVVAVVASHRVSVPSGARRIVRGTTRDFLEIPPGFSSTGRKPRACAFSSHARWVLATIRAASRPAPSAQQRP